MHRKDGEDSLVRRKLLKGIAAGGGVAGAAGLAQWSRPVIESVTLPAYAAMSVLLLFVSPLLARFSSIGTVTRRSAGDDDRLYARANGASLLDVIIPSAHAQGITEQHVLIEKPGGFYDYYRLDDILSDDCRVTTLYIATNLTVDSSVEVTLHDCSVDTTAAAGTAVLVSVSETTAVVTAVGENHTLSLDPGAAPLSLTPCPCFGESPTDS